MNPLSRAIWRLARLGAEAEQQEAADDPGRLAAASENRETAMAVPFSTPILQYNSANVNTATVVPAMSPEVAMAETIQTPVVRAESTLVSGTSNMYELHREALARAYSFLLSLPRPDDTETTPANAHTHMLTSKAAQEVGNER